MISFKNYTECMVWGRKFNKKATKRQCKAAKNSDKKDQTETMTENNQNQIKNIKNKNI